MAMLTTLHEKKSAQIVLGLLTGIAFGFLLQKGGVTEYSVIVNQLLLVDFTVMKLMFSAVMVAMIGLHVMKYYGYVQIHPAEGTIGANVIGGLIFGVGFALLGYCPGTVAGAVGSGALDALFGGMVGLVIGTGLFADLYPRLKNNILKQGPFPAITVQELLHLPTWIMIVVMEVAMIAILVVLRYLGL
jgi:uncharacterized protein